MYNHKLQSMEIILVIALIGIVLLIISITKANSKIDSYKSQLAGQAEEINQNLDYIKHLENRVNSLSKYSSIEDAEKEADRILQNSKELATKTVESAELEADRIKTEAKVTANEYISKAKEKLESTDKEVSLLMSSSLSKSEQLIKDAENNAREIAGNAYEIAKNAEHYTMVATAMKNIIEGYGDEYLVPTESVLDSLAEEFSYTDAGIELKAARDLSKQMVIDKLAAQCDYVQEHRRDKSMQFVTDAFNGKVDSILSLVKNNNYGALAQKIKDAYSTVNWLGSAFRDARITESYLNARLSELRWAVAVMALKVKEKEEQRRIKEQMREEERARREYERAIKEAEKEEVLLRKAMDKARAEIAQANEEQKAFYEEKLAQLSLKLSEAEARGQRAISMAQQTKSGHVYVISNIGSFGENVYKIGMTRRLEPKDRVRELGDASVPFPFDVHAMIYSEDAPALETALHKTFSIHQVNKVNPRKEFFRIPISEIRKELETRNLEISWTMLAEAAEYRESLAIEKSLVNTDIRQEWEQKQTQELQSFDDTEEN